MNKIRPAREAHAASPGPRALPGPDEAPDLLDRLRARFAAFPLIKDWGLVIQEAGAGSARLVLAPGPFTVNSTGIVNGGVLASLADMACAIALSTHFDGRMPFATADLHIRYLEPARGELAILAGVVRVSARSGVLECRILSGETIAATATAQFVITTPRKAAP